MLGSRLFCAAIITVCFMQVVDASGNILHADTSIIASEDDLSSFEQRHIGDQVPLHSEYSKHGGTSDSGPLPISNAEEALSTLQGWYNNDTGLWETTGWWNAANVLTMIGDFAQANPKNDQLQRLARHVLTTTCTQAPRKNPSPGAEGNATYGQGQNTVALGPSPVSSWYHKILDENTFEPHSIYPLGWDHDTDPSGDQHALNQPPAEFNLPNSVCTTDPYKWLDGYYDDDLWWALAWINAYDLTQDTKYLRLAESIFTGVSKSWPTHCFNGGIYWNNNSTYVNAIANELFLSTAAHLANRAEDNIAQAKYEDWSKKAIYWFLRSGMINKRNAINDGLDNACHNNNGTVWTYNQGVIIGGLVELSRLFPNNSTYMTIAHRIASATIKERTDVNGILYDNCEPECYRDGTQFKGVFMRNLQRLYRASPQESYKCFIENNARSIWENNRENGVLSVRWAGPFKRPGNSSTHSSAMDALVAAVVVG